MNALTDNGIMAKLRVLCMPILAGDKSEAFVNLADANLDKETDLGASQYYNMLDDGLANTNTESGAAEKLTLPSAAGLKMGDLHIIAAANMEYASYASEARACICYCSPDTKEMIQFSHSANTHRCFLSSYRSNNVGFDTMFGTSSFNVQATGKTVYGMNIKEGSFNMLADGGLSDTRALTDGYAADLEVALKKDAHWSASSRLSFQCPHWVVSVGEGLTAEQCTAYIDALHSLLSVFGKVE